MIICFECDLDTKKMLDTLVTDAHYSDINEAIKMAIANLTILHNEISKRGTLIFDTTSSVLDIENKRTSLKEIGSLEYLKKDMDKVSQNLGEHSDPKDSRPRIPSIFQLQKKGKSIGITANMPMDLYSKGQEVPIDRWIFGQYNRLLPAKASCRALSNLIVDDSKGIDLENTSQHIAKEAVILGEFLEYLETKMMLSRDDALSTAFPSKDKNLSKSCLRYADQFVATINKQGQISGLLIDLKLINRSIMKSSLINLTKPGWKFALMMNPILDRDNNGLDSKFSKEEIAFLLEHISSSVPTEDSAYKAILDAIIAKACTPDEIDNVLRKYVSNSRNKELGQSFLSTQRSGAISRMSDLGLVERNRDGTRVVYLITETGRKYLERGNN